MKSTILSIVATSAFEYKLCEVPTGCFEIADAIDYHESRADSLAVLVKNLTNYIVQPDARDANDAEEEFDLEEDDSIMNPAVIQEHLINISIANRIADQAKAVDALKKHLLQRYDIIFKSASGELWEQYNRLRGRLTRPTIVEPVYNILDPGSESYLQSRQRCGIQHREMGGNGLTVSERVRIAICKWKNPALQEFLDVVFPTFAPEDEGLLLGAEIARDMALR